MGLPMGLAVVCWSLLFSSLAVQSALAESKNGTSSTSPWKCFLPIGCYSAGIPEERCPNEKRTCPAAKCRAVRGLYNPSKVLDAETGSHGPPAPGGPYVSTPAICCNQCSQEKGCNVWNFCWDPEGCGYKGSCSAYNKKYPKGEEQVVHPKVIRGGFSLPCTADDRFPQYFCILRQAGPAEFKGLKRKGSHNNFSWTSGKIG